MSSDDPRADQPIRYLLTGLASFVLLVLFVGLLLAPLALALALLRRGAVGLSVGLLGLYFTLCGCLLVRLFRKRGS